MVEIEELRALPDSGLAGCAHARTGSPRQVLLMDNETLELMDLRPGILRENITTRGINVNGLPVGSAFALGRRNWK
jgi:MOSC domain-containing protein YiiM